MEQPGSRQSKPGLEDLVQPLGFRLRLHQPEPGTIIAYRHWIDLLALDHFGRGAQILDPAIGAGADEHPVDRDVGDLGARAQAHVVERTTDRCRLASSERSSSGSAPRR
jgi:hypothetical protein